MPKKVIGLGKDGRLALKSVDGRERPIVPPEGQPTAYLLVDCSSSMSGEKIDQARDGAAEFAVQASAKGYHVGLISFDSSGTLLLRATRDLPGLTIALRQLSARGTTNMTAALDVAWEVVGKLRGNRAILVVSDGQPDDVASARTAACRLADAGIQIITVATSGADTAFLASIATASGISTVVRDNQLRAGVADSAKALPAVKKKP